MLQIIDKELMAVLVAGVAEALHGLSLKKPPLISEAAKFQLVRPHVLGEIPGGNARRPGLQHQHFGSAQSQDIRALAPGSAGPDDEDVIFGLGFAAANKCHKNNSRLPQEVVNCVPGRATPTDLRGDPAAKQPLARTSPCVERPPGPPDKPLALP